jgi:hypothetical protein
MSNGKRELKLFALRLSALSKSDQRWLLRQLPAATVQALRSEMAAIEAMGIANGLELYHQLTASEPADFVTYMQNQQDTKRANKACDWLKNKLIIPVEQEQVS